MFGYTVRGPLKLLKEKLSPGSTESIYLLQYVSDFCTKLVRVCESAKASLYPDVSERDDVDTVKQNFKPGQKVLAL